MFFFFFAWSIMGTIWFINTSTTGQWFEVACMVTLVVTYFVSWFYLVLIVIMAMVMCCFTCCCICFVNKEEDKLNREVDDAQRQLQQAETQRRINDALMRVMSGFVPQQYMQQARDHVENKYQGASAQAQN